VPLIGSFALANFLGEKIPNFIPTLPFIGHLG
jgi:hypothetical protein